MSHNDPHDQPSSQYVLSNMGKCAPVDTLVGRDSEVSLINELIRKVSAGQGRAVWIEGEPGIGKSSLVAATIADAADFGCETAWATADDFNVWSPLSVMLDCLDIRPHSRDGRPAGITRLLKESPASVVTGGIDPVPAALEKTLSLVDELCAANPLIMVVDDIQSADDASLIAWHRLAQSVKQLPLLLVAISRSLPQRPAVGRLRRSVLSCGGVRISLGPLSEAAVDSLVAEWAGAPAGPQLHKLAGHASGNPLYLRELVDALLDEHKITLNATHAELDLTAQDRMPTSLASMIKHRLGFLSPELLETLGAATLLGQEFTVADLAAILGTPASTLLTALRQATAAAVIAASGRTLRFRHPLVRQALYDGLPSALRAALHRQAAEMLAKSGAPVERVAEQLIAASSAVDRWTLEWIATHASVLTQRTPRIATELLQRAVDQYAGVGTEQHETVVSALAKALFRLGRRDEAEKYAWRALAAPGHDGNHMAEMRWILTRVLCSTGRNEEARSVISHLLRAGTLPPEWQARFQALSAMSLRADAGDLDGAESGALEALALAEAVDDRFGIAYALCVLWLVDSVRRNHEQALRSVDRALAVLGSDPEYVDLRFWALENRLFTLQNLDRLRDAEANLKDALAEAGRSGDPATATLHINSAVHDFWLGRWDNALAVLDSVAAEGTEVTHFGLCDRAPALLYHGVAALVAGHRDDREAARRHLDTGLAQQISTTAEWENYDFLLAAQALGAEREGSPERALALLTRLLECRPGQMSLIHQWLPDLVRLAVDLGDTATARMALNACEAEAARELLPARAASAVDRCRGLLEADPALVLSAADHYSMVGRPFERAQTLEDAAVLLARQGGTALARTALTQAAALYAGMGAEWDIRRAGARIRPYGIRLGARGPRPKASFGWQALSPTELKVARLVAEGKSNPEVAADLFLSRRTVQTHVSHILVKLGAHSRVEIATKALRHGEQPDAVT